jgi:hypothetical protein
MPSKLHLAVRNLPIIKALGRDPPPLPPGIPQRQLHFTKLMAVEKSQFDPAAYLLAAGDLGEEAKVVELAALGMSTSEIMS